MYHVEGEVSDKDKQMMTGRHLRAVFGGLPEPNRACLVGVW